METTLKRIIDESGLKQEFIARKLDIHPAMLSRYKYGLRIQPEHLAALAKFFKVRQDALQNKAAIDQYSEVA